MDRRAFLKILAAAPVLPMVPPTPVQEWTAGPFTYAMPVDRIRIKRVYFMSGIRAGKTHLHNLIVDSLS